MALSPVPDRGRRSRLPARSPSPSRSPRRWSGAASPSRRSAASCAPRASRSAARACTSSLRDGAPPTAEQLERLASVLGVSPGYFAEYRLWRARALLDPGVVGFDRAMANFDRLRGRRDIPFEPRGRRGRSGLALSWPGQQPVEGARMSESEATAEETAEEDPRRGGRGVRGGREDRGARRRAAARPRGRPLTSRTTPTIEAAEEELLEEAIPVPAGPRRRPPGQGVPLRARPPHRRGVERAHHLPRAADPPRPSAAASSTRSASCPSRSRRRSTRSRPPRRPRRSSHRAGRAPGRPAARLIRPRPPRPSAPSRGTRAPTRPGPRGPRRGRRAAPPAAPTRPPPGTRGSRRRRRRPRSR